MAWSGFNQRRYGLDGPTCAIARGESEGENYDPCAAYGVLCRLNIDGFFIHLCEPSPTDCLPDGS